MMTLRAHPDPDPGARAPALRPEVVHGYLVAWAREWPAVHVRSVEIVADEPAIPVDHRRVRACVHLGRLAPADVRVYLAPARALVADVAVRDDEMVRLLTGRGYGNGTFVFEAHVADRLLEGGEALVVLVEPGDGPGGLVPPVTPAIGRLPARPLEVPARVP